jgi:hypothetical protein
LECSRDGVGQVLKPFGEFGAAGCAAAAEQPPCALQRVAQLLHSFSRCARRGRRGLWLGRGGRALREEVIKIGTPDPDATADPDGG